tara:strand:+ start:27 stop:440 length:414 start_codon:yes stop_codon:yes gene_type:complete
MAFEILGLGAKELAQIGLSLYALSKAGGGGGGGNEIDQAQQREIGQLLINQMKQQQGAANPLMNALFPQLQERMGQKLPVKNFTMPSTQGANPFGAGRTKTTATKPGTGFVAQSQSPRHTGNQLTKTLSQLLRYGYV